jgi:hypothetical protein
MFSTQTGWADFLNGASKIAPEEIRKEFQDLEAVKLVLLERKEAQARTAIREFPRMIYSLAEILSSYRLYADARERGCRGGGGTRCGFAGAGGGTIGFLPKVRSESWTIFMQLSIKII